MCISQLFFRCNEIPAQAVYEEGAYLGHDFEGQEHSAGICSLLGGPSLLAASQFYGRYSVEELRPQNRKSARDWCPAVPSKGVPQ